MIFVEPICREIEFSPHAERLIIGSGCVAHSPVEGKSLRTTTGSELLLYVPRISITLEEYTL